MVVYNVIKNTNPSAKSGVIGSSNTGQVKLQHTITVNSANCLLKYADSDLCYGKCVKKLKNYEYCLNIRNGVCDEDCLEKYKSIDYCKCIKKKVDSKEVCSKKYLTEHFSVPKLNYDELKKKIKMSVIIVLLLVLLFSYYCKNKIFC
tara:strand:- start:2906 stop:3346 length:441 start_codon:yes stop_codon:yes gene_type:complete